MGKHQTAEEVKQEYIEKLGSEFGTYFDRLRNEVIFLHLKWSEFEELYGKKERVELMNSIAPNFFFYLQNLLLDDVILGITRLTENKIDRTGNERFTLHELVDFTNPPLKGEVSKQLKRIKTEASFCYDHRNRKIAHFDRSLKLEELAESLEVASRYKINKVMDSIAEVMNLVNLKLTDSTINFRTDSNFGYKLLQDAENGRRFDELRFKYLKGQPFDISDFDFYTNK